MKIDLRYGKGLVSLQVPERNIEQIIRPWQDREESDNAAILRTAVKSRDASAFQRLAAAKRLCVLLDDGTRDEPFEDIFGQLFPLLKTTSDLRFIICTGTHEPDTPENNRIKEQIKSAAARVGIGKFRIHTHDCEHDSFITAGQTSRGTPVVFNAEVESAEVFLVISDMKTHYFAGYSNPIKNFVPGVCAFETTERNHSLALDAGSTFGIHPWHSDCTRRDNPLAQDQLEAMQMIVKDRPVYALVTITTSKKIQWAGFGPVGQVVTEAIDRIDRKNIHEVTPTGRLVVSPGGLPNDVDLYIAQRALELTQNAVADGGEVLFLAACPQGPGEPKTMENFYNLLTKPLEQIFTSIESRYKLYSHKPYKFAQMIKRLRKIWIHSQMPDEMLQAAHLYPTHQPQQVVDNWLAEDPRARITIVDGANKIALYAKK